MHSCCLIAPPSQNKSHLNGLLVNCNRFFFSKLTKQKISCDNVNKETLTYHHKKHSTFITNLIWCNVWRWVCTRSEMRNYFWDQVEISAASYAELCITHRSWEEIYERTVLWRWPARGQQAAHSHGHRRPIQWCFLELFVIFVYKKRRKKLFQNDLNECIFVDVHGERSDTEERAGTSPALEKTGTWAGVSGGLLSFFFGLSFFPTFFTEPFTS